MACLRPVGSYYRSSLIHFHNSIVRISQGSHRADEEAACKLLVDLDADLGTLILHFTVVLPWLLDETGGCWYRLTSHEDVVAPFIKQIDLNIQCTLEKA